MTFLFYLLIIPILIHEFMAIVNTDVRWTFYKDMMETVRAKDVTLSRAQAKAILFNLFYCIWTFIGAILSVQWPLFLLIIVISMLPFKKYKWYYRLDAIISFILLLFIAINHFQLHYTVHDVFK